MLYMTVQLNDKTFVYVGVIYGPDEAQRMATLAVAGAIRRVLVWDYYKHAYYPHQIWDKYGVINCTQHPDMFGPNAYVNRAA